MSDAINAGKGRRPVGHGVPAIVVAAALLISSALLAQPVLWEERVPGGVALVAGDGAGSLYSLKRVVKDTYVEKRAAADGVLDWATRLSDPWVCALCGSGFGGLEADMQAVYVIGQGSRGPMLCALGCGNSYVHRLSPADGTQSNLYFTPVTQPPSSSLLDVEAAPAGAALIVGYDAAGGLLVRRGAAPLDIRFGTRFERVVSLPSGAFVALAYDTGALPLLRRYDAAGTLQWSVPLGNGICSLITAATDERVACLAAGGLSVFDQNGGLAWGPVAVDGVAMAFEVSGALWVAGRTACDSGHCQAHLVKFGVAGNVLASDTLVDPLHTSEWRALSIGPSGDVYVTGLSRPLPNPVFQPSDMITARYSSAGVRQWLVTYRGAGNWNDVGESVVTTADGAIVGGSVHDSAQQSLALIKYGAQTLLAPGAFSLTAVPNPATPGAPLTLTALLSGAPPPSGTVTFANGANTLCAAVALQPAGPGLSAATCTLVLTLGTLQVTASYSGDGVFAAAVAGLAVVVSDGLPQEIPLLPLPLLAMLSGLLAIAALRRLG